MGSQHQHEALRDRPRARVPDLLSFCCMVPSEGTRIFGWSRSRNELGCAHRRRRTVMPSSTYKYELDPTEFLFVSSLPILIKHIHSLFHPFFPFHSDGSGNSFVSLRFIILLSTYPLVGFISCFFI